MGVRGGGVGLVSFSTRSICEGEGGVEGVAPILPATHGLLLGCAGRNFVAGSLSTGLDG